MFGPLFHFGKSQNEVIFLKLIIKISTFSKKKKLKSLSYSFTLFKNLMPFFFYTLNS